MRLGTAGSRRGWSIGLLGLCLLAVVAGPASAGSTPLAPAHYVALGDSYTSGPGFVPTAPASPVHPNALGMANSAEQVLASVAAS